MTAREEELRADAFARGPAVADLLDRPEVWVEVERTAREARRARTMRGAGMLGAVAGAALLAFDAWAPDPGSYGFVAVDGTGAEVARDEIAVDRVPAMVADVALACGATLPEPLPDDRAVREDVALLEVGGQSETGRFASVRVWSAEPPPGTELSAVAVLAFDDVIVAAVPVSVSERPPVAAAGGVPVGDADGWVALEPGECVDGEVEPAMLEAARNAGAVRRTMEAHVAVVAVEGDSVLGHWFDPVGTGVSFQPLA
ncbi:hypothetical protein [Demequina sp. NBRC 110054]|uniref:hypothetical protein n=1 Tax=Demequina sp. NBRC 110054 TaxID=1570343 RepID=UPI000A01CFAD|nr:hypothetical protein [Demequina sp. NBRC 110054]